MKKENRVYKYRYNSVGKDGKVQGYSPQFDTKAEAKEWYENHGKWLAEKMGRNLEFVKWGYYEVKIKNNRRSRMRGNSEVDHEN